MTQHLRRTVLNTGELNALLKLATVQDGENKADKTRQALEIATTGDGSIALGFASLVQKELLNERSLGGYAPVGDIANYVPALWNPQEVFTFIFRGKNKYSAGAVLASPESSPVLAFVAGGGYYSLSPAVSVNTGEPFEYYNSVAYVLFHEFIEGVTNDPFAASLSLETPQRQVLINALAEKSAAGEWEAAVEDSLDDSPKKMEMVDIRSIKDFSALLLNGPLRGQTIVGSEQ